MVDFILSDSIQALHYRRVFGRHFVTHEMVLFETISETAIKSKSWNEETCCICWWIFYARNRKCCFCDVLLTLCKCLHWNGRTSYLSLKAKRKLLWLPCSLPTRLVVIVGSVAYGLSVCVTPSLGLGFMWIYVSLSITLVTIVFLL